MSISTSPPGHLPIARPSAIRYTRALARLAHLLIAALPGLILLQLMDVEDPQLIRRYLMLLLLFGLACVLVFQAFGMYGEELFSNLLWVRKVFFAWSATFGLMLMMHLALRYISHIPPALFALWFALSLSLFITSRLLLLLAFRWMRRHGHYLQRAVILGYTDNGMRLAMHMHEHGDIRTGLIGFIDDRESRLPEENERPLPRLGGTADLERLVREERIDVVLIALPWSAEFRNRHYAKVLKRLPVKVLLVPDMTAFRYAHNRITPVGGLPMLNVSELPLSGWSPLFKRSEDLLLGGCALLLLAPLMLLIALAVWLDSPGPVLFRQKRYGYNQRLIEVCKFRSMHHHLRDEDASRQTGRGDPRVTRVGRWIRKTSLDELPQLFNVLGGSMSMVGPRPHATATKAADVLFEDAVEEYSARHRVKPGITGWAQIHGYRGETDTLEKIERRVEYDLQYIEAWSLWLDLYILARTVPAVLLAREAY